MKNLLLISLLLLTGCADDTIEDNVAKKTAEESPKGKTVNSTNDGNVVNGLHYSPDSTHREAIIMFNDIKILEIANLIIENILHKNKKLEFKNDMQEAYGYFFTPEVWDTLAAYGYQQSDVTFGEGNKAINLQGQSPYIEKQVWEEVKFNNLDLKVKHPKLYNRAVARFWDDENPKINEIKVDNQGGSFVDYSLKVSYNAASDQYVYYTVSNTNERLVVSVDKFGMK